MTGQRKPVWERSSFGKNPTSNTSNGGGENSHVMSSENNDKMFDDDGENKTSVLKNVSQRIPVPKVVKNTSNKVSDVAEKFEQAKKFVQQASAAIQNTVTGFVSLVTNPVTWVVTGVVVALFLVLVGLLSVKETVGRNENADGCYGIAGSSTVSFTEDESDDWTVRGNQAGTWLLSQTWDFLGGQPMSKEQVAGILGNFIKESGITYAKAEYTGPNSNGSMNHMSNDEADVFTKNYTAGLGLAQWTHNPGRAGNLISLARSMGGNWYDAEVQLQFMKNELESSYGASLVSSGFSDSSKSERDYAVIFHNVYEKSADSDLTARQDAATEFLSRFSPDTGGSAGASCTKGSNVDTSSVAALAISISYPTSAESVVKGDLSGASVAPQAYKDAKAKAQEVGGIDPMTNLYASCDRFAATVIKNTVDTSFPWGDTSTQYQYLKNSPLWEEYTSKTDAQPGDVWVTRGSGHIIIYVGDVNGQDSIAHASYQDRVGAITSASYLNDSLVDTSGRQYSGFRFVG